MNPAVPPPAPVALPEYAYLETGAHWDQDGEWPKNMLLLFDGVTVLLPEREEEWFRSRDEALIAGLEEHNVLSLVRPEQVVDKEACDSIVMSTLDLLSTEQVKRLAKPSEPMEFYISKFGAAVDSRLVDDLVEELKKRELATPLFSKHSVAMHPVLGVLVLGEIAKHVVRHGLTNGYDLFPSTDNGQLHRMVKERGGEIDVSATTKVIASDFEAAGIELGAVPVDEIVSFRQEHRDLLNRYRLGLMEAAEELVLRADKYEQTLLKERRERFATDKAAVERYYREWLKGKARLGMGVVGALGHLALMESYGATKHAIGAAKSLVKAIPGLSSPTPPATTRMTFLLAAGQRFGTL